MADGKPAAPATGIGAFTADDDLIEAVRGGAAGLLRVRPWTGPPTAVLGAGGNPAKELNLEAVAADGLPVLRRRGGGCAVLLDRGNVLISLATRRAGLGGFQEFFGEISPVIADALDALGLPGVRARGISDLALAERKISGSCIYRAHDLLHYSATLLVSPDADRIARYLAHPPREPEYRAGRDHAAFLGRLAALPSCPSAKKLAPLLERELAARLGANWSVA